MGLRPSRFFRSLVERQLTKIFKMLKEKKRRKIPRALLFTGSPTRSVAHTIRRPWAIPSPRARRIEV
ncbi:hypothetical protein GW17_00056079, partial [Ensete ventricosum]